MSLKCKRGRRGPWARALACALFCVGAVATKVGAESDPALRQTVVQLRGLAAELQAGTVPDGDIPARTEAALAQADTVVAARGIPAAMRSYLTVPGNSRDRAQRIAAARAALLAAADRLEGFERVERLPAGEDGEAGGTGNVRRALTAELADDMYGTGREDAVARAWAVVRNWVRQFFEGLVGDGVAPWLERVSFFLMVTLLIAACGLLAWLYLTRYARRPGRAAGEESPVVATRRMADPQTYHIQARDHAAAGRFRDAVRALFLMTLAELERRELVAFDRTRTNGEYLHQLHRRLGPCDLTRQFLTVTRVYDRAWYGRVPCSPADYAAFEEGVATTVQLAGGVG